MARANRHHIPGQVWHITHRCHKKEFLLKFGKDRRHWHYWLFEAKKRFGLQVLNFTVTSNHIHLLVVDTGPDVIPMSLQLIAGRTAQEFNRRKKRNGAFWEDRYHATAVERNEHLIRCLVYIDLNMVRAGVVGHPSEWEVCGYNEIQQHPPARYAVIDHLELQRLCGFADAETFRAEYRMWVEAAMGDDHLKRDGCWSESVAVGSRTFIEGIKAQLGSQAVGRGIKEVDVGFVLREEYEAYTGHFTLQKDGLSSENAYYRDIY